MHGSPVGFLSKEDPLYGYLQHQIAPRAGLYSPDADYRVFRFNESRDVYLYAEERLGIKWVGKFFKSPDPVQGRIKGEREFNNLTFLRDMGFSSPPHYVVRPLGFNPAIDNVLVVEYLSGDLLSRVINDALYLDRRDRLFRKLSALASFLAALHNRTARHDTVDFDQNYHYMGHLVASLIELRGFKKEDLNTFRALREVWRSRSCMWEDRNVIVHGDTTPSNFLFGRGKQVMSIDLERMKWSDRVFDLGRLCGELKHFFLRATNNPFAAEPFIGHFLREYCGYFPDRDSAFRAVTLRVPFYMGITLLRIARNSWIDETYRYRLIREAKQILAASV